MSSLSLSRHLSLAAIAVAALALGAAPASAGHDSCSRPARVVLAPSHGFAVGIGTREGSFSLQIGDRGHGRYRSVRRDYDRPVWRSGYDDRWRREPVRDCRHRFRDHQCGLCGYREQGYYDRDDRYDRYDRDRYDRDHCEHGRNYRDGCDRCNPRESRDCRR